MGILVGVNRDRCVNLVIRTVYLLVIRTVYLLVIRTVYLLLLFFVFLLLLLLLFGTQTITAEQVMSFFLPCGEIKFVRMAGDETQPTR